MKLNTHITEVDGIKTTLYGMDKAKITVRFTTDKIGETLSLESKSTMIVVPFEEVEKLIKKAREERV